MRKIFLLSPAKVSGVRTGLLLNPRSTFALARQFQREGLPLADVFAFASGLYFRGKITYARRFARENPHEIIRIITTNAGLLTPEAHVTADSLQAFGEVEISADNPRYHEPLRRDGRKIASQLDTSGVAVLLGSIATGKYRDVLLECFGTRLMFPADFVGRGDMSRGGLLLRAARDGIELPYAPVLGAVLNGKRAPRLAEMARPTVPSEVRKQRFEVEVQV